MTVYDKWRRGDDGEYIYLCDILDCECDAHAQNVESGRMLCKPHYDGLGEVAQQRNWVLVQQHLQRKKKKKPKKKWMNMQHRRGDRSRGFRGRQLHVRKRRYRQRFTCKHCGGSYASNWIGRHMASKHAGEEQMERRGRTHRLHRGMSEAEIRRRVNRAGQKRADKHGRKGRR